MRYNYVIFQSYYDYYDVTYHDIKRLSNVEYINRYPMYGGNVVKFLCNLHRSKTFEKLHLPFQDIWNPFFFKNHFSDNKPICFLFSAAIAGFEKYGLITYLRKKYPNSKFVCFYQDIVDSVKSSSIEQIKSLFDLVLSYDSDDAKKYGLLFHNTVFSDFQVEDDRSIKPSDVYFVGAAKDRLPEILETYHLLISKGIKCDFNIIGVPHTMRHALSGVHYIDNMTYLDNLKHVKKTKVVLEIMQKKASGASLRMWECINYDKLLLTNNEAIKKFECFNSNYMHLVSDIPNIREWINTGCHYASSYKDAIRPLRLLEFIDKILKDEDKLF